MANKTTHLLPRLIKILFLLLIFATPLIILPWTSELFEMPKMLFVYFLTLLITTLWLLHLPLRGKLPFRRTPLDIPIAIFLISQILSTIFSIHPYTSVWGWHTRLHGGLASTITYIVLYYAFVTFFTPPTEQQNDKTKLPNYLITQLLNISLISGLIISLYAIAQHFGIDAHLWVQDVQNRVFSTLGQPNWLAAFLTILLPLSYLPLLNIPNQKHKNYRLLKWNPKINLLLIARYLLPTILFLALLYTRSRSGFLAFLISNAIFWIFLFLQNNKLKSRSYQLILKPFLILNGIFLILSLTSSTPFTPSIFDSIKQTQLTTDNYQLATNTGGTSSFLIRLPIWKGAIELGKRYPIFGTGPETFGYTYYWVRPAEHNLNSEWEFLYNKAHNEYLNFLANTGFIGLCSYLLLIGGVIWLITNLFRYQITDNRKQKTEIEFFKSESLKDRVKNSKLLSSKSTFGLLSSAFSSHKTNHLLPTSYFLLPALLASYASMLITNLLGFSIVIIGVYFFLIPALIITISNSGQLIQIKLSSKLKFSPAPAILAVILLFFTYSCFYLYNFFKADLESHTAQYLIYDNRYTEALKLSQSAVKRIPQEPLYHDQLAEISGQIAVLAYLNQQTELQDQFLRQALQETVTSVNLNPYDLTLWKNQASFFITLSTIDSQYLQNAINALEQARQLAPTEPKILYNLALLQARQDNTLINQSDFKNQRAIQTLETAVQIKSDYLDAYYALALFYHEQAVDNQGNIINQKQQTQALQYLQEVLKYSPQHPEALEKLKNWQPSN